MCFLVFAGILLGLSVLNSYCTSPRLTSIFPPSNSNRPTTQFSRVDFPLPFVPMTTVMSSDGKECVISTKAFLGPHFMNRFEMLIGMLSRGRFLPFAFKIISDDGQGRNDYYVSTCQDNV